MRRSEGRLKDSKIYKERQQTYKGIARISLDVLYFQPDEHRNIDPKQVNFLKECFQKDRCRRLESKNYIEATIDEGSLDAALRKAGVSNRELLEESPYLRFPRGFQLRCRHGQHRILAAREYLLPDDKWWTVELYTSGMDGLL